MSIPWTRSPNWCGTAKVVAIGKHPTVRSQGLVLLLHLCQSRGQGCNEAVITALPLPSPRLRLAPKQRRTAAAVPKERWQLPQLGLEQQLQLPAVAETEAVSLTGWFDVAAPIMLLVSSQVLESPRPTAGSKSFEGPRQPMHAVNASSQRPWRTSLPLLHLLKERLLCLAHQYYVRHLHCMGQSR